VNCSWCTFYLQQQCNSHTACSTTQDTTTLFEQYWHIFIGRSASHSIRYDQEHINHCCQTQFEQDVFIYLDRSAQLTPPWIARGHYWLVFQACQRTGKGDLAGQDRHGYEQCWPGVCILANRTEQLGVSWWKQLCWWQAADEDNYIVVSPRMLLLYSNTGWQ